MAEKKKSKGKHIITVAKERFAHFGFSKVTMDEIAQDVGMGKASLYYYFPTKERLFNAVIQEELDEFVIDAEVIIQKKIKPSEKLIEYVNKRFFYFQRFLNLGALSTFSFLHNNAVYKKYFKNFEAAEIKLLNKIFSEGMEKNEFSKDIDKNTISTFIHILQGLRLRTAKTIRNQNKTNSSIKNLKFEMNIIVKIFIKGISN